MQQPNSEQIYEQIAENIILHIGLGSQKDTVTTLSKWLGVTETAIYNKLKGRSKFTVEEIHHICSRGNLALDNVFAISTFNRGFVPFFADGLKFKPRSYDDFLNNIINYYSKIQQLTNVHGYFLANEVPLFHFLSFPHLMYLKMHIWNDINWHMPNVSQNYDSRSFIKSPEITMAIKVLKEQFHSFPDTEIWNPYMLDNTISQYLYLRDSGIIIDRDDIKMIEHEFEKLIDHLEALTMSGIKPENARGKSLPLEIYITDLSVGSEVILVLSDDFNMLFQQIDVPNYMQTTHDAMIKCQYAFFKNVKEKSVHITKAGEREKRVFFARMRAQLSRLKQHND
jgi:hypothetical protein